MTRTTSPRKYLLLVAIATVAGAFLLLYTSQPLPERADLSFAKREEVTAVNEKKEPLFRGVKTRHLVFTIRGRTVSPQYETWFPRYDEVRTLAGSSAAYTVFYDASGRPPHVYEILNSNGESVVAYEEIREALEGNSSDLRWLGLVFLLLVPYGIYGYRRSRSQKKSEIQ